MVLLGLLFLASVLVGPDQAELRGGCQSDDMLIAAIPAGTPVDIRFALNDGSDCYRVSLELNGVHFQGYLPGSVLSGLEGFEDGRRRARDAGTVQSLTPAVKAAIVQAAADSSPELQKISQLIQANQLRDAQPALEALLRARAADPDVLLMAGWAAYRGDDIHLAIDYWKKSLELRPNPALENLYRRAQQEAANDRSSERLFGMRVVLRYDGQSVAPAIAQRLVAVLDEEIAKTGATLGCGTGDRLVAILQTRQDYLRSTDAAEWSGGQYDGRIRVALPEGGRGETEMRHVFAHEIVHACLTAAYSRWPAWFQEGLAQKLAGDTLPLAAQDQLKRLSAQHALPRLENLAQSWSRMSTQHARLAYNMALAAADLLLERYANYGLRNILNNPGQLASITPELDKLLGL